VRSRLHIALVKRRAGAHEEEEDETAFLSFLSLCFLSFLSLCFLSFLSFCFFSCSRAAAMSLRVAGNRLVTSSTNHTACIGPSKHSRNALYALQSSARFCSTPSAACQRR